MSETIETDWEDFPTCPHCGQVDQDWWDGTSLKDDGDTESVECFDCGKPYVTTMHVDVKFSTVQGGNS